jgi:23S rRNA (cytidine1920-2'-O)/16S rRNA (cytidine1409-2'-O)-methyltransferase
LQNGYDVRNLSFSPITGGDGNIEFLLHLFWAGDKEQGENRLNLSPKEIVQTAHAEFKSKEK